MKKVKTGQALVETMVTLSLYFFIIGFTISGFQLMYNKMAFSVAAYEACREAVAYESSKKYAQDSSFWENLFNSGNATNASIYNSNIQVSAVAQGKHAAAITLANNVLAPGMFNISDTDEWEKKIEIYGLTADEYYSDNAYLKDPFQPNKHMFCVAVVQADMNFLFPIISPDFSQVFQDSITLSSSFILAKERIWNN